MNPECEAQEALLRIAFEIELQWGAGKIDLGRLKALSTGGKCDGHDTPKTGEHTGTLGMIRV